MNATLSSLLLLSCISLVPVAFGSPLEDTEVARLAIRDACVNKIAVMQPPAFQNSKVSPGFFCTCVAKGHANWATNDISEEPDASKYLSAILALYRPTTEAESARARKKYFAEYDNDMNIASNCFTFPAGNGMPRTRR